MPNEVVGVKKVGSTSFDEIMASTANMEAISAVLPGGAAVTFAKGQALIDHATVAGKKAKYGNATAVSDEAVGSGDGSDTTFDLDNAKVIPSTLKGYSAGNQKNASISVGTGTGGVDQIVFAVAPANGEAIVADYSYHASAKGVTGACVLLEDAETTVAGGDVVANALVSGSVKANKVKDSGGNEADSYFKDALKNLRFV